MKENGTQASFDETLLTSVVRLTTTSPARVAEIVLGLTTLTIARDKYYEALIAGGVVSTLYGMLGPDVLSLFGVDDDEDNSSQKN